MHQYTIDFGNSHPHIASFQDFKLEKVERLQDFLAQEKTEGPAAISNVGGSLPHELNFFAPLYQFSDQFQNGFFRQMPVNYSVSLGQDRLYQSYYIYKEWLSLERKKIILLDSGTFTTLDCLSEQGHRGGPIFPGIKSLTDCYHKGAFLPEVSHLTKEKVEHPQNTQEAIQQALSLMIFSSLEKFFESIFKPDFVILTGGQALQFENFLNESHIPFVHQPHFIHYSLLYLMKERI